MLIHNLREHEWNKHGTCYSTLNPTCYTDYQPQDEVIDFFNQTITLFQTLPTYEVCMLPFEMFIPLTLRSGFRMPASFQVPHRLTPTTRSCSLSEPPEVSTLPFHAVADSLILLNILSMSREAWQMVNSSPSSLLVNPVAVLRTSSTCRRI